MTVTRNHVSVSNKICSKFHSLRISAARYIFGARGRRRPRFRLVWRRLRAFAGELSFELFSGGLKDFGPKYLQSVRYRTG